MIGAGQLDQRVTIQQPGATIDALGQRVEAWSDVATVWAQALPTTGREFVAAGSTQDVAAVRFKVRYRSDITAAMRVLWRGVPHAIVADPIDGAGMKETLELICASGVRDGQ